MWRSLVLILWLIATTAMAWAQRSYFRIGRTQVDQVVILDEGGHLRHYRIAVQNGDSVEYLFPSRVDEYRNYQETLFRSYDLPEGERVFLEVLAEGSLTLLYLLDRNRVKRFFLELAPGALLEMSQVPRNELYFKEVLSAAWRECPSLKGLIDETAFQKSDLRYLVQAHNSCEFTPRPKGRWVIRGSLLRQRLSVANNIEVPSFRSQIPIAAYRNTDYEWLLSGGVSLQREIPLGSTYWYATFGLQLQYFQAEERVLYSLRTAGDRAFQFDITTMDFALPLGLRYVFPWTKLRPTVYAGVAPSYWWGKVDGRQVLFGQMQGQSTVTLFQETISPWGLSLQLSPGVDYQLNDQNEIRIEAGLQQRYGLQADRIFHLNSLFFGIGVTW